MFICRYATKKSVKSSNPHKNVSEEPDKIARVVSSPPSDRGDVCVSAEKSDGDGINYIKLNKQRSTVASKLATQLNNGVPPSSYRKGVIPKYVLNIILARLILFLVILNYTFSCELYLIFSD